MYVSITGLRPKNIFSYFRFWLHTVPALKSAQKSEGVLFCDVKRRGKYQHSLTVWETKEFMALYREGHTHTRAMRVFPSIATGHVHGFESKEIPTWDEALAKWDYTFGHEEEIPS